MVKEFLKIAGVKNQSDFYKKYPTEEAFFKAHPEAMQMIKEKPKMSYGGGMYAYQIGGEPVSSDYPDYRSFKAAYDAWEAGQNMPITDGSLPYTLPAAGPTGLPDYLTAQQTYGVVGPQPAAAQRVALNPYEGVSVYDFLQAQGKAGDYRSRKQLAKTLGIEGYKGIEDQNKQMMEMIRQNPDVLTDYVQSTIPAPMVSAKSSGTRKKAVANTSKISNNETATPDEEVFDEEALTDEALKKIRREVRADNPYVIDPIAYAKNYFIKTPYGNMHLADEDFNHPTNAYPGSIPFGSGSIFEQIPINQKAPLYKSIKPRYIGMKNNQRGIYDKAWKSYKAQLESGSSRPYIPRSISDYYDTREWKAALKDFKEQTGYQAGGSYNPTFVDYSSSLPMFNMGASMPQAMYGLGMANGGTPCYNCGGMYAKGGIVKGGEYDMSEDEIQDLINQGYKIEYV